MNYSDWVKKVVDKYGCGNVAFVHMGHYSKAYSHGVLVDSWSMC